MRKTFNEYYFFEIMDRLAMLQDALEDNIRNHPAMRNSWKKRIDEAQNILYGVYSSAAMVHDRVSGAEEEFEKWKTR